MNWTKTIVLNDEDILTYRPAGGDTIEIYDIVVNTERGVGVGTLLLEHLIYNEKPKRVVAVTRNSNVNAQKFYTKNGFTTTALPKFYPDEDAVMCIKVCE